MARKLIIPIGSISPAAIEAALEEACAHLASGLQEKCGAGGRVLVNDVLLQYEATEKKSAEATLKNFQKEISIRLSFARGAKLNFVWTRSKPEAATLSFDSSSQLEDCAFGALFGAPALIALVIYLAAIGPMAGRRSGYVVLVVFLMLLPICTVPYLTFRGVMRAKNADVFDKVDAAVREMVQEQVDSTA